jgi:arsenite methyltransferase
MSNAPDISAPEQVRSEVAKAYGERVSTPAPASGGCCGGGSAQDAAVIDARKGAVVEFAGYTADELAALPDDAVVNSFGCGNPLAMAGLRPGDAVLDLGSGAGIDLLLAARLVGPEGRVIGVDMTDEMIARAEANIAASGFANVEVRKGIIEELPVQDSSVDWVISNCVINLSPEKDRVFKEIARVLRPGGQMLVSDIVAESLPPQIRMIPAAYSSCISGAISEADYLAGLRAAGLEDVEVRDRLVYDAGQLASFATSATEGVCGCGSQLPAHLAALVEEYARKLEGQIWSAKVYARKPA